MDISVIFTTYNQPRWLELVLWGFSIQSHSDFEIVIADDGSKPETAALIADIQKKTALTIQHIWHEDNGFQKCSILNKAIVAAKHDYLVFTDGDCIPHPDFLKTHNKHAQKNAFLSGGYFKLPQDISEAITIDEVLQGLPCSPAWLRSNGMSWTPKMLKLQAKGASSSLLDMLTTTRPTWNGHNASTWKEYALAINGFDERMQYGGQDREFGERLENIGVRGKQIRHKACCVHLHHKRGYATPESIAKNKAIRADTVSQKITKTEHGIEQMLTAP